MLRAPGDPDEWRAYHAIRRAVLFEARGLVGVYDENHPDEHRDGHHPLLFFDSDEAIGVIRVDVAGTEAVFRRVAIRADRQRQGHGARIALAEGFARARGCVVIRSSVDAAAVGFYERCGYVRADATAVRAFQCGNRSMRSEPEDEDFMTASLAGKVALVAGATRGAGRGIAVQLGAAGATVYVTGRSTRARRSEMNRPETIEETAVLVDAAGGRGIAVQVDHLVPDEVRALVSRIEKEQGRLNVLVNDIWGATRMEWNKTVWESSLDYGLRTLRLAVDTHAITSHFAIPLLIKTPGGLVVEVTDGTDEYNATHYRVSFFYDLAKAAVGRAVAALAADPDVARWNGKSLSSGQLAKVYGFTDTDGSRPDAWRYVVEVQDAGKPADTGYR